MNAEFFKKNRSQVLSQLKEGSIAIVYSGKAPKKSADEAYPFTPNRHFYYLTGIAEEEIFLVLAKHEGQVTTTLFIKAPDPFMAKWVGATISDEAAKEASGIDDVRYLDSFEQTINRYLINPEIEYAYFDLERGSFDETLTKEQTLAKECQSKYPSIQIKNVYPIISKLRTVKSPEEIELIKKAIKITQEGVESLMTHAKSGIYEYQLEAYFDFVLKSHGVKDYAFKTIAASGENGTILHYDENNSIIKEDSLILFDLGAQYQYYNADITRTFPVSGKFTERQKLFYNIVLKAHDAVIQAIKPGTTLKAMNDLTRAIYLEELGKLGMVSSDEEVSKYYYHGVSHFLGLDTHDVGERSTVFESGMVMTVEPGLYIAEEGIGIRIEDDVMVTEKGCEVLSKDMIRTVDEIEAFMGKINK